MTSIVAGLSAQQISALSVSTVAGFTSTDIGEMSAEQVAGLTASQMNSLSMSALQSMSARQVSAISYGTFMSLAGTQTANFTSSQITALKPEQIKLMSSAQLNALGTADLQAVNVAYLTKNQIAGLSAGAIGNMTDAQIGSVIASQGGALSTPQVQGLTTSQLNNLTKDNLQRLNVTALAARQIAGLSASTVANLAASQVGGLTQAQSAVLTATQVNSMSPDSVKALNLGTLNGTTVSGLATTTLASLSTSQTRSLLATHADKLSVDQISSLSGTQVATTSVVGATNGLRFELNWDASVSDAPAGFRSAAIAAAAELSANLSNNTTVSLQLGYGEVHGSAISPGAAASTESRMTGVTYSALRGALQAYSGNSSVQATAAASIGASDPTSGGSFAVSTAQARALGLGGGSSGPDGYIGLSSAIPFEFNRTAAAGKFDAIGAFQHEMTEAMGRTGSVGAWFGAGVYTALDLFRYTSTDNVNPQNGTPIRALTQQSGDVAYFSIDGGATNLGGFNASDGSLDYGDWNGTMVNDPFGFSSPGVVERMSGNDIAVMAAIGWNMTPTGVTAAQAAKAYALV